MPAIGKKNQKAAKKACLEALSSFLSQRMAAPPHATFKTFVAKCLSQLNNYGADVTPF